MLKTNRLQIRSPQTLANQLNLVLGVSTRQKHPPQHHLRKNAPHAPHVSRDCVLVAAQKQLGSSVPASCYVLSQNIGLRIFKK